MAKVKKISVGSLDAKSTMENIYFDDSQFTGIPSLLRVPFDHFKPRGDYDRVSKKNKPGSVTKLDLSAWNESSIQGALKLEDTNMQEAVLSSAKLMPVTVLVPDADSFPEENDAFQDVVAKISDQFDQQTDKDLILSNCSCHVVPLSADYGTFKGMKLALYNFSKVKFSFADPIDFL